MLKHLHQGCGTPEDHHTTCSQARTQLLARGGGFDGGYGGSPPEFVLNLYFHLGHTHSSSVGSVLVLLALIVLKHLHQGCGTPEDHHTTCSQARTQLLARGGGFDGGYGGSPPEFVLNLYARWWHLRAISTIFRQCELCTFSDFHFHSRS